MNAERFFKLFAYVCGAVAAVWRGWIELTRVTTSLKARVDHNDERIDQLFELITSLHEQNKQQQKEIDDLRAKIKVAETDKIELQMRLAVKEEELRERIATIAMLEAKLKELGVTIFPAQ